MPSVIGFTISLFAAFLYKFLVSPCSLGCFLEFLSSNSYIPTPTLHGGVMLVLNIGGNNPHPLRNYAPAFHITDPNILLII